MNRKEQITMSVLKNVRGIGNCRAVPEGVILRIVSLELAFLQASITEIRQALKDSEEKGRVASTTDEFDNLTYVLTQTGEAFLLSRG